MSAHDGRAAGVLLLVVGLGLAATGMAPAGRGRDAGSLLLASEQAERKVSYAGTKVLSFYRAEDGSLLTERVVKVWHREPSQTRVEMVTPAEALGMIVLETGDAVWIFHPKRQSWRQMAWRAPDARPQLLLKNYEAQMVRRESVAGRPAFVIRLTSRNPGNPSKMVWIDTKTRLALRQELYDPAGKKLSTSEFREITFEPSLPTNLFTVPAEARVEPKREGGPPWGAQKPGPSLPTEQPRYVPAGYELVQRFCLKRPDREFAHLRYTDGLNTISLFIERCASAGQDARGDSGREGRSAAGRDGDRVGVPSVTGPDGAQRRGGPGGRGPGGRPIGSAWRSTGEARAGGELGQRLTVQRGETRYTLVGNISLKELRRMADSIAAPDDSPRDEGAATTGPRGKR
jgi:outer membrane lipoprotein-sorting protein